MLCQPCNNHCLKSEPVYDFDDMQEVVSYACKFFKTSENKIRGKSRKRELVIKRHMMQSYLFSIKFPLSQIGKYFNRHHTSIMYGRDNIKDLCTTDEKQPEKHRIKSLYDSFINYMKNYEPKNNKIRNRSTQQSKSLV